MRLSSVIMLLLLAGSACTYDNEEELFGEAACQENVSFTEEVRPIIAAHCAIPGCHVSGTQIPDYSQVSTIINRAGDIRTQTKTRTMPPPSSGITLTAEEIRILDCWVAQGGHAN